MKITDIETILLSHPLEKPIRDAQIKIDARNNVLVRVYTDEGITGLGEAGQFRDLSICRVIVEDLLKPILIEEDPFDTERLSQKMYARSRSYGRRGYAVIAISGIDVALWDIIGKATGKPVYKILGGCRDRVEAYASGGFYKPEEELVEEVEGYVKRGYFHVKMKVGFNSMADVKKVMAVREAIGGDVNLMIDANQGYDAKTAIRVARELEPCNLEWFEEPTNVFDLYALKSVTDTVDVRVSAGENWQTLYGFIDPIINRAVDIVQPDAVIAGGITECRKIAALANSHGMPCIPHTFGATVGMAANLHFIASIPNGYIEEIDQNPNPLLEVLQNPLKVKEGYIEVPKTPGLGVALNEQAIAKYALEG